MSHSSTPAQDPPRRLPSSIRHKKTPVPEPEGKVNVLLSVVFAGLLSGLVTTTYSLSYAVFVFSGPLSGYLSFGIQSALLSAMLVALLVALGSSFSFSIAGPDSNSSAILALITGSIVTAYQSGQHTEGLLPTIWMAIVLSSLVTGLFLFLLGRMRLGRLIRFIPYPVVGGFLAGTGWLITKGAFSVMTGRTVPLRDLPKLIESEWLYLWLPGFIFAIVLFISLRKFQHYLIMPALLVSAALLFYLGLWLTETTVTEAQEQGWLFASFSTTQFHPWKAFSLSQTHWWLLLEQSTNLMAMMAVVSITILLNATGIELATMTDAELDRELVSAGAANVLTGFFGGMIGYISISRSLLNQKAGGISRLSGVIAALFCGLFLLFGAPLLVYLPKPILGGLLLYLGLALLAEWLLDAFAELSAFDYMLVWLILLLVAFWGFLPAVSLGTVIACLLFAFNYSRVEVVKYVFFATEHSSNVSRNFREKEVLESSAHDIYVLCLQGYIFFGTANSLFERIRKRIEDQMPKLLVMDFRLVSGLDSSAALSFLKIRQLAEQHSIRLILTHLPSEVHHQLKVTGCLLEDDKICRVFADLDRGIEHCENVLLKREDVTILQSRPLQDLLAAHFPPEYLPKLEEYLTQVRLTFGETLFEQGSASEAMYFVETGQLSVHIELSETRKKRLTTMGPGTVVGEMGCYLERPRSASVLADIPTTLYKLDRKSLDEMQDKDPALASALHQYIVRLLSDRLTRSNQELRVLLR